LSKQEIQIAYQDKLSPYYALLADYEQKLHT